MRSHLSIRKANNYDSKQIIQLVKQGLKEFGFEIDFKTSESDLLNIEEEYNLDGGTFLIAKNEEGQVVATGGILKITDKQYKIRKMYVDKNYRRIGLGKRLLVKLENHALKNRAKEVFLETTKSMKPAINLYKSFGFKMGLEVLASPRCEISMIKTYDKK